MVFCKFSGPNMVLESFALYKLAILGIFGKLIKKMSFVTLVVSGIIVELWNLNFWALRGGRVYNGKWPLCRLSGSKG